MKKPLVSALLAFGLGAILAACVAGTQKPADVANTSRGMGGDTYGAASYGDQSYAGAMYGGGAYAGAGYAAPAPMPE